MKLSLARIYHHAVSLKEMFKLLIIGIILGLRAAVRSILLALGRFKRRTVLSLCSMPETYILPIHIDRYISISDPSKPS